ncbi:MAG: hydroxymethylglutaryl-CoA reductase (NADPH) [Candidatus Hydrothermarchaeota archaeon]
MLKEGKIKTHELEKFVSPSEAISIRRKYLEDTLNVDLTDIGSFIIDPEIASRYNIEHMIGAIQVPLGIAGPVRINGDYAKGEFYLPLATTEGALVASVNRGCSIINASGGSYTKILEDKMTRAPVFQAKNIHEAIKFKEWIYRNFEKLKEEAESTTRHGELKDVRAWLVGRTVFLRFSFDTKDAMGMNMVTIATDKCVDFVEKNFPIKCISLSGNLCVDKKPSALNLILGRGKTIIAETFIPEETIKDGLNTSSNLLVEVNYRKNLIGSSLASSYGFNAHFANIIAAMFLATGQDIAQVVEGSHGFTLVEKEEKGVYFSVTLPALEVGTVGGGTRLETQRNSLKILGIKEGSAGKNAKKLAEIIATGVLAGEISLIGALAAKELASSHKHFARRVEEG